MTDQTLFVDAYDVNTGIKQRIPREWLDDPKLGAPFRKTPSQRELDGDLPARPAGDATAKEIDTFAEAADIDLTGIRKNDDKLVAIETAMGPAPVQTGVVSVDPPPPVDDPLAPEKVAHVDPQPQADAEPAVDDATDETSSTPDTTDGTEPTDDTPAAGDKE